MKPIGKIGQHIVEFEQGGNRKAEYGKALINNLSADLTNRLGKGFSRSNLIYMRLFYLEFPISEKPSHQLSWSHYVELLKISDKTERSFYTQQSIIERWSIPELKRQKKSSLYLRLAISKDKKGILKLATTGQRVKTPQDIIREPYILDFLKIPRATAPKSEGVITSHNRVAVMANVIPCGKHLELVWHEFHFGAVALDKITQIPLICLIESSGESTDA